MNCPTVIRVTTAQGPPGIGLPPGGTSDIGKFLRLRRTSGNPYDYELVTPDAISLPQALGTSSSPTFAGLTLSGLAADRLVFTGAGGAFTGLSLGSGLSIANGALVVTGGGGGYPSLSVPTGFAISGSASATMAITFAAGYSLPANTTQASWTAGAALAATSVQEGDARLTDARPWNAAEMSEAEARAGVATTARQTTAQRLRQAAEGWWDTVASTIGKALATATSQAEARTAIGAETAGAATAAVSAHVAASDPHSQYLTQAEGDAAYASASATSAALANKANNGAIDSSGLTMATLRILGRTSAGDGSIELISVVGATLAGQTLTITGATDLSYDPGTRTVASSTGADAVITLANQTNAGLMSSADYSKLLTLTFSVLPVSVYNNTGATIAKGTPVYVTGSSGGQITIASADASVKATAARTLGITSAAIDNNLSGTVIAVGEITGLNTSTLNEGEIIWLSETTGEMTTTRPIEPAHGVMLGYCVKQSSSSGIIYVKVDNSLEIDELHDVLITGRATGQALMVAADGLWKNRVLVAADLSDSTSSGLTVLTGTPAQGRAALELGSAAQASTTNFATAAQGQKADSAVQPATLSGYVQTSDASLTNAREWIAATINQPEAEGGVGTTRQAWTAQRVRQAIVAWWGGYASSVGQALATATDATTALASIGGMPRTIEFTDLPYAATVNIDFAAQNGRIVAIGTLTGNITFTFSNIARGRQVIVRLVCDSTTRDLLFPPTTRFQEIKPAKLTASKVGFVSFTVTGTDGNDASVDAVFSSQS